MLTLTLSYAFMAMFTPIATYTFTYVLTYMFAHASCAWTQIHRWVQHIAHHTPPCQQAPARVRTVIGVTQAGTHSPTTAVSH